MDKNKNSELKSEYSLICDKLNKISGNSKYALLYEPNPNKKQSSKELIVDCQVGSSERSLIFYGALICATLKGTHFESSKCYKHKEGFGRYYITPDWKYFFGDEYKNNHVIPLPIENKIKFLQKEIEELVRKYDITKS